MGILSVTPENFNIPYWQMTHPEVEDFVKGIKGPCFMVWYVVPNSTSYSTRTKTVSMTELSPEVDRAYVNWRFANRNILDPDFRSFVQQNFDLVANSLVRFMETKETDFKFLDRLKLG